MARRLKILFVTSEAQPFAKTGGLGDVCSALPVALHRLGHDVRVILPKYQSAFSFNQHSLKQHVSFPLGHQTETGNIWVSQIQGHVPLYLIQHDAFFNREGLYGTNGEDYPDNAERFAFFCRAALETCKTVGFQPDIIHCHDWQAGLVPVYLKSLYAGDAFFQQTRTVFTIHNLGYQGNFPKSKLIDTRLPDSLFHPEGVEFYDHFSFMKSALVFSDQLSTVSKTYSKEILNIENGFRMEGVLQARVGDLHGILNGIDYEEWNPKTDPWIAKNYNADHINGKSQCKKDLIRRLKLKLRPKDPLWCMVTRLSDQKGLSLVQQILPKLLSGNRGLVILGVGEPEYENYFTETASKHPKQFACRLEFSETLAHQIIAGSDLLLMPSKYEPCGLTQMYALRYGTIPVVRAVGGLADTVKNYQPKSGKGNGFNFKPFEIKYLLKSIQKAEAQFQAPHAWNQLIQNAMATDLSWERAAKHYVRLYRKALKNN